MNKPAQEKHCHLFVWPSQHQGTTTDTMLQVEAQLCEFCRSISKDEKEKENLKKSSPLKSRSSRPRTAPAKGNKKVISLNNHRTTAND